MAPVDEPITPIPAVRRPGSRARCDSASGYFTMPRLSHDNSVACTSCHQLDKGGDDDQVRSIGADGRPLDFNTSTVFNAALSFRLNWRGNFRSLEEQNEATLPATWLMNTNWEELLPKLRSDRTYRDEFTELYGAGPQRDSVLDALANYQRSLITPDARFDRYLRGDQRCHHPRRGARLRAVQGQWLHRLPPGRQCRRQPVPEVRHLRGSRSRARSLTEADLGRFAITGIESDRHVFRVPSLRNVAVTAPYFHDGRTASLGRPWQIMARNQLGRELEAGDVDLIVKFLGTLTGEYRGRPLNDEASASPAMRPFNTLHPARRGPAYRADLSAGARHGARCHAA